MFSFRAGLCLVLAWTVFDRWGSLQALYSDDGVLPVVAWRESIESPFEMALAWIVCVHAWFGSLWWAQLVSATQLALALLILFDRTSAVALLGSLWLYASATVRAPSSAYILDRYVLLELTMACFGQSDTFLWHIQMMWIYADAGWAKAMDPGWSNQTAAVTPALDAYVRHTPTARIVRAVIGRRGLRVLTPLVPFVELVFAPFAVVFCPRIGLSVLSLFHLGIGLCMNGAALLSTAAVVAWLPLLEKRSRKRGVPWMLALVGVACAYSGFSGRRECLTATSSPLSALFHNRWNVFSGSDTTVTWEVMPGKLVDGSTIDVWAREAPIDWNRPRKAARGGRWRTFPMIGQGDDVSQSTLDQTYGYFCTEWNSQQATNATLLSHFHVYMLLADDEDENSTRTTRKRLLHAMRCDFERENLQQQQN